MTTPQEWQEAFKELEPDKQAAVQGWVNTQMFICRELGLETDAWFEYIEWAFQNPFDFTFAMDAAALANIGADGMASEGKLNKAAASVGVSTKTKLPGGGGIGNLLGMVVSGKKEREGK